MGEALSSYVAYTKLNLDQRRCFDTFRADSSPSFLKLQRNVSFLAGHKPVIAAVIDWKHVIRAEGVFSTNGIKLANGAIALYPRICLCSHSCAPNCEIAEASSIWGENWHGHARGLVLRAIRDLSVGEDLSISYVSGFVLQSPRAQRRSLIKQLRGFACRCPKCMHTGKFHWHAHIWKGARVSRKYPKKVWKASGLLDVGPDYAALRTADKTTEGG